MRVSVGQFSWFLASLSSHFYILFVFRYDGISNLSSMETYNVEEDSWTLAASMVAHEGGVGIGVIPIAPEML